jgi:hypothetical protein
MTPIESLRSKLIDKILVTENEELLEAIETIIATSSEPEIYNLDTYQIELLKQSESEIKSGDIISEKELFDRDREWMS